MKLIQSDLKKDEVPIIKPETVKPVPKLEESTPKVTPVIPVPVFQK